MSAYFGAIRENILVMRMDCNVFTILHQDFVKNLIIFGMRY